MNNNDKNSDFSSTMDEEAFEESVADLTMISNDEVPVIDEPISKKKNNPNVRRRIEDLLEVKKLLKDLDSYNNAKTNDSSYEEDLFNIFYLREKKVSIKNKKN